MNADIPEITARRYAGVRLAHPARDQQRGLAIEMGLHFLAHLTLERWPAHERAEPKPNAAEHPVHSNRLENTMWHATTRRSSGRRGALPLHCVCNSAVDILGWKVRDN